MISGFFFFVMCFFEVKINLIFSQLWQDAADKIARRLWRAIFLSILGDENGSGSFRVAGGRSEHAFRSFFFLLQIRETETNFMFS